MRVLNDLSSIGPDGFEVHMRSLSSICEIGCGHAELTCVVSRPEDPRRNFAVPFAQPALSSVEQLIDMSEATSNVAETLRDLPALPESW